MLFIKIRAALEREVARDAQIDEELSGGKSQAYSFIQSLRLCLGSLCIAEGWVLVPRSHLVGNQS